MVVERAPQHLQKVGSLGAREPRDVAKVELGDRQQRIRPGVSLMPGLELVQVRAPVRFEEVLAGLARAKPGGFEQRPPLADIVEGDGRLPVVVFLRAGRPFLVRRPQERSADGAVVNGRAARAGVQADGLPGQRSQLREYGRDVLGPGWGGSRHPCSFSSQLRVSGGLYLRVLTALSTVRPGGLCRGRRCEERQQVLEALILMPRPGIGDFARYLLAQETERHRHSWGFSHRIELAALAGSGCRRPG